MVVASEKKQNRKGASVAARAWSFYQEMEKEARRKHGGAGPARDAMCLLGQLQRKSHSSMGFIDLED